MSYDAIRWALAQTVGKASRKHVLIEMANCVNDEDAKRAGGMLCFPSHAYLAAATELDIKTVEKAVQQLREDGFIVDTGERRGRGAFVYRLNTTRKNGGASPDVRQPETIETSPEIGGATEPVTGPEIGGARASTTTETGGASELVTTPVFPASTPVFPNDPPKTGDVPPPKTGDGSRKGTRKKEPGREPGIGTSEPAMVLIEQGVGPEALGDWITVRKSKRAGPITESVVRALQREAKRAGITLAEAVAACAEYSWQGFEADWYFKRKGITPTGTAPGNRQEALEHGNRAVLARRMHRRQGEVFETE